MISILRREIHLKAFGLFVTNTLSSCVAIQRWMEGYLIVYVPLAPLILFAVAKASSKKCKSCFDLQLLTRGNSILRFKAVYCMKLLSNEKPSITLKACLYYAFTFTGLSPFTKF